MKTTLCTLFEGHYHHGVGGLANSLSVAGFQGTLWAGHRGPIPPWASPVATIKPGLERFEVGNGFSIVFVHLDIATHFAYFKPEFLDRVLAELAPEADAAIYIDPDIIVKCPWHLLERWPTGGIALVQDVHSSMPPGHPMRLAWKELLVAKGLACSVSRDRYYNSGFVGIPRALRGFLEIWREVVKIVVAEIGPGKGAKHGAASDMFHSTDQDAMNMALMASDAAVNGAGSEAMDFSTGGYLLSHAIGTPKPWSGGFVKEALRGFPPSLPSKEYLAHAEAPIALIDKAVLARLRFSLSLGAAIGRFYRRS